MNKKQIIDFYLISFSIMEFQNKTLLQNLFNLRKKRKILKNKEYSNFLSIWVWVLSLGIKLFEYLGLSFEFGYQTFWVFGFGFEYWVYSQYSNHSAVKGQYIPR
jgi:hypothetical protein